VEAIAAAARAAEAQTAGAQTAGAQIVGAQAVGAQAVDTQAVDTQAVDPKAVDTQAVDPKAAEIRAIDTPPSAGAASPSGMVKPPPLTPLSRDEPTPSGTTPHLPAVGPIDGNEAMVSPDDDTAPLPVILPDRMPDPVGHEARMRDPFEPIERPPTPLPRRVPQSESGPAEIPNVPARASAPSLPQTPGAAEMDQIKDLYLTAEAIGEDALTQHFQQVSDRQRQLIKEYFDQIAGHGGDEPTMS